MKKILGLLLLSLVGCEESSDYKIKRDQEKLAAEAAAQVGMPAIVNFQEKRIYKMILELRDTEIKTTTYITDMQGQLHKICDSIGYGIPYATQFTNPQKDSRANYSMPQADPNGLFSPATADGTWVLCLNSETKKMSPVFVEPRVIVSPFALK